MENCGGKFSRQVAADESREKVTYEHPVDFITSRTGWNPILAMKSLQNSFNELLGDIFYQAGKAPFAISFSPRLDMFSDGTFLYLLLALPGARREDIQLHATPDLIIVQGIIPGKEDAKGDTYHCREIPGGEFSRSIPLPYLVEHEKVKARLGEGILKISVPIEKNGSRGPVKIGIE